MADVETKEARKRLTIEERIEIANQKLERAKAEKRKLELQQAKKERNARTKRLIEVGATVESVLGVIKKEDLSKLKVFIENNKEEY